MTPKLLLLVALVCLVGCGIGEKKEEITIDETFNRLLKLEARQDAIEKYLDVKMDDRHCFVGYGANFYYYTANKKTYCGHCLREY